MRGPRSWSVPILMPAKLKYFLFFLCAAAFFLSAAYLDLALRARSSYLAGERYMAWVRNPALKKDFLDGVFSAKLRALEAERDGGRLSGPDLEDKKNLLLAEHSFKTGESSAKYAYIWYKTAAADFSPPVTRWARLARQKAPEALALWKAELKAGKIEFKDYQLE